ncbi:MAG: radical SAM protein, partial [Candidatus Eremiobacteraeota bacterium]|nr:radical SAM protein [Candidatus Eremiobacteraeota bacterium]
GLISPLGIESFYEGNILSDICKNYKELIEFTGDELECMPNLGLLIMASFFSPEDELCYIEDQFYKQKGEVPFYFNEDFDLILVSGFTLQSPRSYEIADHFRGRGIPVIMGGQHASSLPEEAKNHADAVVIGEGEDVFRQVLEDFRNGKLKPFYYSKRNIPGDQLPSPRFDILKFYERYNKVPIQATRGCPYSCEFCSIKAVYGNKYRKKPVHQVINEIKTARKYFPNFHVVFVDENMMVDKKYSKELVRQLIPLDITWEGYVDITVADDEELLDLMRESNCVELEIGIETVNQAALEAVSPWKAKRVPNYNESIRKIQEHGVGVMGLFMVGFDQDGPDIFERMWNFIKENDIFEADLAILNPLPGSPIYKRLKKEGRVLSEDWTRYTWNQINFQPKLMDVEDLRRGMIWLQKQIHSPEWTKRKHTVINPRVRRLC